MATIHAVSIRRRAANRRNAQLSTGPKNFANSKYNRLSHGLLAKDIVIERGPGREDPAAYEEVRRRVHASCQPVGIVEELFADKIAGGMWRLARADRVERGEIEAGFQAEQADHDARVAHDLRYATKDLTKTSHGLARLLKAICGLREDVDQMPDPVKLTGEHAEVLGRCFGDGLARFHAQLQGIAAKDPSRVKPTLLRWLDAEKNTLMRRRQRVEQREADRARVIHACLAVPPTEAMERILRYRTAFNRELLRDIEQLQRLQEHRRRTSGQRRPRLPRYRPPAPTLTSPVSRTGGDRRAERTES